MTLFLDKMKNNNAIGIRTEEREDFIMTEKIWNKNVRFNTNSDSAMRAWDLLHSEEVENNFKSQNEFIICAINDYYERHISKKNNP